MRDKVISLLLFGLLLVSQAHGQLDEPGEWRWRFITGGEIVGLPVFDRDGTVYFTTGDRFLYSVDTNGELNWRTDLQRRAAGFLAVGPDGSLYCGLEDGRFLAINKDGRLLWEAELSRGELLPPLVTDSGMVILADRTGRVAGFTHQGQRIWSVELGERLTAGLVFDYNGAIVAGSAEGSIFRVSTHGEVLSRRFVGSVPVTVAPVPDGLLIGTNLGFLIKLLHDDEPVWREDLGSAIAELVVGTAGESYAQLDDGTLVHVTAEGTASWRIAPLPSVVRNPIAADGVVVLISGGSIAHIGKQGSLSWQQSVSGDPIVAAAGPHTLLVSTDTWVTFAFDSAIANRGEWPVVRGRPQATGAAPGVVVSRKGGSRPESTDYVYLSRFLRSPSEGSQLQALDAIEERIGPEAVDPGLAGSYGYILDLCEEVAGAPYYGPVGFDGRSTTSLPARQRALSVLGRIGDLGTARFLLRLLRVEENETLQAAILWTLGELGTGLRGDVIRTVAGTVSATVARRPSDLLAVAASECIRRIYHYEGGFVNPSGVELLTSFVVGGYSRQTREVARSVLSDLSSRR